MTTPAFLAAKSTAFAGGFVQCIASSTRNDGTPVPGHVGGKMLLGGDVWSSYVSLPYQTWQASTAVGVDAYKWIPTFAHNSGHYYKVKTAGTTGATEPTWPTTAGATVTDGTVVWVEAGVNQHPIGNGRYWNTSIRGTISYRVLGVDWSCQAAGAPATSQRCYRYFGGSGGGGVSGGFAVSVDNGSTWQDFNVNGLGNITGKQQPRSVGGLVKSAWIAGSINKTRVYIGTATGLCVWHDPGTANPTIAKTPSTVDDGPLQIWPTSASKANGQTQVVVTDVQPDWDNSNVCYVTVRGTTSFGASTGATPDANSGVWQITLNNAGVLQSAIQIAGPNVPSSSPFEALSFTRRASGQGYILAGGNSGVFGFPTNRNPATGGLDDKTGSLSLVNTDTSSGADLSISYAGVDARTLAGSEPVLYAVTGDQPKGGGNAFQCLTPFSGSTPSWSRIDTNAPGLVIDDPYGDTLYCFVSTPSFNIANKGYDIGQLVYVPGGATPAPTAAIPNPAPVDLLLAAGRTCVQGVPITPSTGAAGQWKVYSNGTNGSVARGLQYDTARGLVIGQDTDWRKLIFQRLSQSSDGIGLDRQPIAANSGNYQHGVWSSATVAGIHFYGSDDDQAPGQFTKGQITYNTLPTNGAGDKTTADTGAVLTMPGGGQRPVGLWAQVLNATTAGIVGGNAAAGDVLLITAVTDNTTLTVYRCVARFPTTPKDANGRYTSSVAVKSMSLPWAKVTGISGSNNQMQFAAQQLTFPRPTTTTSPTGGTLTADTYRYRVTSTSAAGESEACPEVWQATTGSTSTVTLSWQAVSGATGYKIYRSKDGGTSGAGIDQELLLATVGSGATTTYVDNGSVTPSGAAWPAVNSAFGQHLVCVTEKGVYTSADVGATWSAVTGTTSGANKPLNSSDLDTQNGALRFVLNPLNQSQLIYEAGTGPRRIDSWDTTPAVVDITGSPAWSGTGFTPGPVATYVWHGSAVAQTYVMQSSTQASTDTAIWWADDAWTAAASGGVATPTWTKAADPTIARTFPLLNDLLAVPDNNNPPQPRLIGSTTRAGYPIAYSTASADLVKPTIDGASFTATSQGRGQVLLSWALGSDNVAIDHYNVYLTAANNPGGTLAFFAAASNNSYLLTGLADSATYGYTITAVDSSGNESTQPPAKTFTTQSSLVLPTESLTVTPSSGVTPLTVTIDVSGAIAGTNPIDHHTVQILLAGSPITFADGNGNQVTSLTILPAASTAIATLPSVTGSTTYTVSAVAVDSASNSSTPATTTIEQHPVASNQTPNLGLTLQSSGSEVFTQDATGNLLFLPSQIASTNMNTIDTKLGPATAIWKPADHGFVAWSFDPATCGAGGSAPSAAGVAQVVRLHVGVPCTISAVTLDVTSAGSSDLANCFVAVYDVNKNLLAQSADCTAQWKQTNAKTTALTSPVTITVPGTVLVAFWYGSATTAPQFARGVTNALANIGLSGETARFATSADTGLTTAAPAVLGALTSNNTATWVGLS